MRLIQEGEYYFLSRPRRFGKSLLVSTMQELFACNADLFQGLYAQGRWDWKSPHPVISISLGQGVLGSSAALTQRLEELLNWHAGRQQVKFENSSINGLTFFPDFWYSN